MERRTGSKRGLAGAIGVLTLLILAPALKAAALNPPSLTATAISTSQIRLNWNDPNPNETGYQIERSLYSSSGFALIATAAKNATTYTSSGLASGTTYYYRARAVKANGGTTYSAYSNVASARTFSSASSAPAAPSSLAAAAASSSQINLSWSDNSTNETGFKVERATSSAGPWTQIGTTTARTFYSTGLAASTTYYFRVRAYNSYGDSAYSNTAWATTQGAGGGASWAKWEQGEGSFGDVGKSVVVDSTGNVVVAGQFHGIVDFGTGLITSFTNPTGPTMDAFVAKYTSAGSAVWSRGIGGNASDAATGVSVDSGGNVVVTGYQGSSLVDYGAGNLGTRGGNDIFIAKYSSGTGGHIWSKTVGGTAADAATGVKADGSGNVFVTGYMSASSSGVDFGGGALFSAGGADMFLVEYSSTGAHVWSKRFGGSGTEMGTGVAVDGSGNVVVVGIFEGTINLGGSSLTSAGGRDLFVAKFSPVGQHLWSKRFGGTSAEDVRGVAVDGAGDVLLTGQFLGSINFGGSSLTSAGNEDIFLAKLSGASGGHVWSKRLGSTAPDAGYGVAVDGSGNVAITGFFAGGVDFGGGAILAQVYDIFVAKYSSAGAYLSARRYGDPAGLFESQYGDAIAMNGSGNVYITGHFVGTLDFGAGKTATSLFAGGSDAYVASVGP
jgi:hypothetical protein